MKNLLKSIFISVFPMLAFFGLFMGFREMLFGNIDLTVIGLSIISATITVLFLGLFIVPQARTRKNLPVHSAIIIVGFILSLSEIFSDPNPTIELYISFLLVILWILYLFWYSVLGRPSGSLYEVEKLIPDLYLENSEQKLVSIRSFIGAPVIFLFYRGNWCPLCMAQIKEIAKQYEKLKNAGVKMVLISPQPHKFSKSLSDKYDLGFHFLTDVAHKAAKQLGIFTKNAIPAGFQVLGYDSDSVLPTIIITDNIGTIIYKEVADNYRVRPEPETFMRVINEAGRLTNPSTIQ